MRDILGGTPQDKKTNKGASDVCHMLSDVGQRAKKVPTEWKLHNIITQNRDAVDYYTSEMVNL